PPCSFPGRAATGGGWFIEIPYRRLLKAPPRAEHPKRKFPISPGKKQPGAYLRVYGRDDRLVVAEASEPPPGEPLLVKLVEQGRVVYDESFEASADRADR